MEIVRITEISSDLIDKLNRVFVKGKPDGKSGCWNLENAAQFLRDTDNIFLLAYSNKEIAGMATAYVLRRMDDKKFELFFYEIGVAEDFRRQGVGKSLIEELKKVAREKRIGEMFVITNKSNVSAMKLYESTGGTPSAKADDVVFSYNL